VLAARAPAALRRLPRALVGAAVLLALIACPPLGAGLARAHQQGVSYSDIEIGEGRVRYDLVISTHDLAADADGDGVVTDEEILNRFSRLRAVLEKAVTVEAGGVACPLSLQDFSIEPNELVVFRLRGACSDATPVRIVVRVLMITTVDGYNLAKIRAGGTFEEHVFTRTDGEMVIGTAPGFAGTFRRFFMLGVEHIATGYDHVLFLFALLLVGGGWRSLVAIVTAFTIAHSVTLSLAVLDVVQLPPRLVESAIALSIAWVALENLLKADVRGRWRVTFLFGLMHGFGFASILRAMHLPREGLVASLLAFNLGVEAGQLVVVALTYPLVALMERSSHRRRFVVLASSVILVLALWWFRERAFG
jgi:hydrogenase/urease accessory protein HupE